MNNSIDPLKYLEYGVIGVGCLLAMLSYALLAKEQKKEIHSAQILRSIYIFMGFSILLCGIGILDKIIGIKENPVVPMPSNNQSGTILAQKALIDERSLYYSPTTTTKLLQFFSEWRTVRSSLEHDVIGIETALQEAKGRLQTARDYELFSETKLIEWETRCNPAIFTSKEQIILAMIGLENDFFREVEKASVNKEKQ